MFGMDKKSKDMKNPEDALKEADKKLNKGFTGFAAKAFMGKENVDKMNQGLAMGQEAIEMQKAYQSPDPNGIPATAEVLSIQDTGQLVNFDPVVVLQLKVTPPIGVEFETTVKTIVSKVAIPRAGDTINIKYSPADPTKILIQ